MTSPDGITWTGRSASDANSWFSVCWSPELSIFVAVAETGTNRVMTSAIGMPNSKSVVKALPSQMSVDANGNITTSAGYPYYQSLGTEKIVNPPSTTRTVYGVNITAMNKRTRASYASAEACVSTWTGRSAAVASTWYSVCWAPELSLFAAIAINGHIMTSPDGINWTDQTPTTLIQLRAICWSPELSIFVAVATSGTDRVITSSDGVTWAFHSSADDNIEWFGVCWSPELSIFVAVAISGNKVMYSSNGTSWSSSSVSGVDSNDWVSVCWSPELSKFVAVAASGTTNYRVMTSPDGITWTARSAPQNNYWRTVCWSPELSIFVAVSENGTNRVMTSPDGITWTLRSIPTGTTISWSAVCWSPELSIFVATAKGSGSSRIMTSHDGINWTPRTAPENNDFYTVCWSPELSIFVSVSYNGTNQVLTSAIGMPNSKSVVKALPSQMSVDANGNVGIGTTASSSYKLDVNGTARFVNSVTMNDNLTVDDYVGIGTTASTNRLKIEGGVNGNTQIHVSNHSLGAYIATNTNDENDYCVYFQSTHSSSDARFILRNNGNVGIGTTSVGNTRLRIVGSTGNSAQIHASGAQYGILVQTNHSGSDYCAKFVGSTSKGLTVQSNGESIFTSNVTMNDNLTVDDYVGIGTTASSSYRLNVNGQVNIETTTNALRIIGGGSNDWQIFAQNAVKGLYLKTTSTTVTDYIAYFRSNSQDHVLVVCPTGNVGIGTTSPYSPLYIIGPTQSGSETPQTSNTSSFNNSALAGFTATNPVNSNNFGLIVGALQSTGASYLQSLSTNNSVYYNILLNPNGGRVAIGTTTNHTTTFTVEGDNTTNAANIQAINHINGIYVSTTTSSGSNYALRCDSAAGVGAFTVLNDWRVGIGTVDPYCTLHVDNNVTKYIGHGTAYWWNGEQPHTPGNKTLSIRADGAVWSNDYTGFVSSSDRRIKKNIVDVPDNLALEMVRNIPCRYYEYKDTLYSGTEKTIGFIAQEVAEVLPMAISIQTSIIPNEMRKLENVSWEQIENTYKLITDLQDDVSGVKYRFYVSNDVSGNEERKEIIGNSDNTFTFDSSYNNVFIYGKEVNDFHTIDKQKIFSLHHSAIQEIDRIQQQHIIDISNAQSTMQSHETTIQTLQTDLSTANTTIQTLQTDISTANTTIQTLQTDLSAANTTIQQQATTIQQHETTIQQQQQQIADILSRLESLESSA
jgi:hypothetical protein